MNLTERNIEELLNAIIEGDEQAFLDLDLTETKILFRLLQQEYMSARNEIKEFRAAQEHLAEIRNKFVDLYEFAPIGYFILNPDAEIVELNFRAADMLQLPRSNFIPMALHQFVADASLEVFHKHLGLLAETSDMQTCELELKQGDESSFFVQVESRRIEDIVHGAQYFVAMTDITQRKRESQERRLLAQQKAETLRQKDEAAALITALFSEAPVGLAFFDTNFHYQRINRALAEINGLSEEAHIGKTPMEILPDIPREYTEQTLQHVLKKRKPIQLEASGVTPASPDEIHHWITNYYPVNLGEELLGIGVVVINITARKKAEAALYESQERLRINEARFRLALQNSLVMIFNQDQNLRYSWVYNYSGQLFGGELIGKTDYDILRPVDADRLTRLKQQVLMEQVGLQEEIHMRDEDGNDFYYVLNLEPLKDKSGHVIGITGASTDITENRRTALAERDQRVLAEALLETVNAINSSLDLSEVLDYILASMWRVVPHDVAEIMLIDEASLSIVRSRGHSKFNIHDSAIALSDSNMDTPVLRQMREVRHYVLYPDTSNIPFAAPIMSQDSLRSYIGVPLFWQQELIGFLNLASQDVGFFNDQHAERLAGFATQCAIAIRNAQLYQKAQAVAVLEERQRLARDLHDAVSQMLFTSNLIAETLPRLQESDPEKFQENLQKLRFLNRGALAEMRTLLLELRPAKLESTDMYHLLEQFAHAAEGQTRMTIQLEVHEQTRLPPEVHLTFYRVAQEALNNIIKHAKADFVKIIYHAQNHSAFLKIEDDGIGFTVDRASSKSLGLGIMQERMEKIGGGLEVDSEAGAGTIILATWNQPPPE